VRALLEGSKGKLRAYKIAMVPTTGAVAIGEDKGLLVAVPHILKAFGVVIYFVEERGKMDRVGTGALAAIVVAVLGIRDVCLVI
jgi:hypothetical protein